MSSGVPTRPRGLLSPTLLQSTSVSPPKPTPALNIHVGKGPGAIALQIMLRLTKCAARTRVRWCTAAFDGPYEKLSNMGVLIPSTEPTLITRAGSSWLAAFSNIGSSFCVRKNTPFTLVSITLSQPASGNSSIGAPQVAPALLMRTSSLSSCDDNAATTVSMPSIDDRSPAIGIHCPP